MEAAESGARGTFDEGRSAQEQPSGEAEGTPLVPLREAMGGPAPPPSTDAPAAEAKSGIDEVESSGGALPVPTTASPRNIMHVAEQSNTNTSRGLEEIDGDDDTDDGFVAIELATSKHSKAGNPPPVSAVGQTAEPPTLFDAHNPDADFATHGVDAMPAAEGSNGNNRLHQPLRRRVLRHPVLTPLTRLPWDKFITAAGSCDLLFNCKYSMRQVEDEVREEHRKVGDLHLGNGAEMDDRVGREEGYANLSLGNECGGFQYGEEEEEEGSDADDLGQMGLHCLSMMDSEVGVRGRCRRGPETTRAGRREQ